MLTRRTSRLSDASKFRKEGFFFNTVTQDTRDIEFDYEQEQIEREYPLWWSLKTVQHNLHVLPEDKYWNLVICGFSLAAIVWVMVQVTDIVLLDMAYNIIYAIHAVALCYNVFTQNDASITLWQIFGMLVDLVSFAHFVNHEVTFKMFCYYIRLHRPFRYLFSVDDFNMSGSVWGTTAKYCYMFMVLRISWAFVWLKWFWHSAEDHHHHHHILRDPAHDPHHHHPHDPHDHHHPHHPDYPSKFMEGLYLCNMLFVQMGIKDYPESEAERVLYLGVMMSGCLVLAATAVASLSLVISLYMRSEEVFRSRYRLIITEMQNSRIPEIHQRIVETFYRMYWKKQQAVSDSELLHTFPPTLPASIYMDIYFEATQKSKVLKDLSSQFLSEVANKMETHHYIAGDTIIKRNSKKNAMIYITYGDVELLTPEDDMTAVLRLTKGTVLSPCGVAALDGFGRAHLEVRAATYCTAHVLSAENLWKVALKYGRQTGQTTAILDFFYRHIENVKKHHMTKVPEVAKHKSSIVNLKRSLVALKEARNEDGTLLMSRTDYFLQIAGCYVMRNRADASLTDESDEICLKPTFPCILQPTSSLTFAWNFFVSIVVFINIFVYPYYLVFKPKVPYDFRLYNTMITCLYTLDLIVHLSTGDNVAQGVAITFANTASQQMNDLWFVVDLLATLPIFAFAGSGYYDGINKILKVGKMFRFMRELEFMYVYKSHLIRFCSYTLIIIIACYLTAALQQEYNCCIARMCVVNNYTQLPHWTKGKGSEDSVISTMFYSIYWGMSVIVFSTHREVSDTGDFEYVIINTTVIELCMLLKVFMLATYAATIMVTSMFKDDYRGCISVVKNFLIRNHVDPTLQMRFMQYLKLCWYTDQAYAMTHKKKSIFYDLPPHVYQDIVTKQRSRYIFTVPFLKYLTDEELKKVSSQTKLFYTSPNEILLHTGDLVNEIYVIKQGYCEILDPKTEKVVNLIGPKSQFGILVCLLRVPAYYTVRAATHVQVFSISRKCFKDAINKPHINRTMDYLKQQPEFKSISVRLPPFTSYERPPQPPTLMRFKLPRKHVPDHAFLQPFFRLGFFSIFRYVFPRFTIRPDSTYISVYECFRVCCSFTTACLCPCFEYILPQFPNMLYIAIFMDSLSYFDIIQRLLVGYFDEQGILIHHPASTAAHYLKGTFIVDVFCVLPLELLEPAIETDGKVVVTSVRTLLSMNRMVQLYRLPSAVGVLQRFVHREEIRIIFIAVPLFIALLNVVTSFMVLSSVEILYDMEGWYSITPLADKGGSWIQLFQNKFRYNITGSAMSLHLTTYFWVTYEITTTGYNVIEPSNMNLIHILLLGVLSGVMMIMYFSVSIISMRANVNKSLAKFQENMRDMITFMEREKLDGELQKEMIAHYKYSWDKMGGIDYKQVFKLCDQMTLRTDAILHIYGPTFSRCPILLQSDASLLRSLGREVHSIYVDRGQTIIETNDIVSSIYFVDFGDVNISEIADDVVKLSNLKLTRGSLFGNLDNVPFINCPIQVVASSKVHLLKINTTVFHEIIDDFPTVKPLMKKFRPTSIACFILSNQKDYYNRRITRMSTPMVVRGKRGWFKMYLNDAYMQIFVMVIALVCVYTDCYNAGFQDNRPGLIVALYMLDAAFYLKMLVRFLLPVMAEEAVKNVLMPQRNEYLQTEFKLDIISCVPLELLCFTSAENKWLLFSWLRLNRLIRISTVVMSLDRYKERITVNMIFATLLSVLIWFTLFVHISACLWYFIGAMEELAEPHSSWMYMTNKTNNIPGVGDHAHCDFMYLCCIYYVVNAFTSNGMNDILPKQQSEVLFTIVLQIVSTFLFMMYVGEFSNVLHYQSFRCFSFYAKYLELQDYLRNNRVSVNLARLVNRYCQHLWRESHGLQMPTFLAKAPQALRLKVMSATYVHHLTRHHVFEDCDPAFLRQLAGCLKVYIYDEGMYVVKSSQITNAMYLIHKGDVQELDISMPEGEQLTRVYPAGSYFGVVQGLFHNEPYTRTYRTQGNSTVLTLHLDDWLYLLRYYPESRDAINQHMRRDEGRKMSTVSTIWPPAQKKQKILDPTEVTKNAPPATTESPPTFLSHVGESLYTQGTQGVQQPDSFVPPAESDAQKEEASIPLLATKFQTEVDVTPGTQNVNKTDDEAGPSFEWPTKRQTSDDETAAVQDAKTTELKENEQESEEARPTFLWPTKRQASDDVAPGLQGVKKTPEKQTKSDTEAPAKLASLLMLEHKEDTETDNIELIEKSIAHESLEPVSSADSVVLASTEPPSDNIELIERDVAELSLESRSDVSLYQDRDEEKEMISVDISKSKPEEASVIDLKTQTDRFESKPMLPVDTDSEEAHELFAAARQRRKSVRLKYDDTNKQDEDHDSDDEHPIKKSSTKSDLIQKK